MPSGQPFPQDTLCHARVRWTEAGEENGPERRARLHHLGDMGFTYYEQVYKHHQRRELLNS